MTALVLDTFATLTVLNEEQSLETVVSLLDQARDTSQAKLGRTCRRALVSPSLLRHLRSA